MTEEVTLRPHGDDETLVRVQAVGIEPGLDARTRLNGGGWEVQLPLVLGSSFSGDVVTSSDPALSPGAPVAVSPFIVCGVCRACRAGKDNACVDRKVVGVHSWGGYAEFAVVPTRNVIPLAPGTSYEQAASAIVSYATAWQMLVTRAGVNALDTVLIVGASGSVGIAAAQIASMYGARVIVGGRSVPKLSQLEGLPGVIGTIDTGGDIRSQCLALAPDGVDLLVETVGEATWSASTAAVASLGRIVCCGGSSGWNVSISLRDLYRRNISTHFCSGAASADVRSVLGLIGSGRLSPTVHRRYGLEQAEQAHRDLENQTHLGKLVLLPNGVSDS